MDKKKQHPNQFLNDLLEDQQSEPFDKNHHSLIHSIANMEQSLAKVLEAESMLIKHSSYNDENDLYKRFQFLDRTLRKIILKEIVMILLMEEKHTKNDCCKRKCKKRHCHCDCNKKRKCRNKDDWIDLLTN